MGDSNPAQQIYTFRNGNAKSNAARISDEIWEEWKETILNLYEEKTLEQVMIFMKENHDFVPTKRQYIHRIGKKWLVNKYNKKGAANDGGETGSGKGAEAITRRPKRRRPSPRSSQTLNVGEPKPAPDVFIKSQLSEQPHSGNTNPPRGFEPQLSVQVQSSQQSTFTPFRIQNQDQIAQQPQNLEDYVLDLNPPDADFWYKALADLLHCLGDHQSAFQILFALWSRQPEVPLAILCARTAQIQEQVEKVRDIIEKAINQVSILDAAPEEQSWSKFLFDAQSAHFWGQTGDETNRSEQFADLVEAYVDERNSDIAQNFTPRSPTLMLDTTAYRYLYHSLLYFNGDENNFLEEDDPRLDINKILGQFLDQQPAVRSLGQSNALSEMASEISCLPACLRWCIDMLKFDHPKLLNASGRSEYNIACMLWCIWIQLQSQGAAGLDWSNDAMAQLDMSPSELLVTVVCMIMATELDHRHTPSGPASEIIRDALGRAITLLDASPPDLLDLFLHQIRETSEQRMTTSQADYLGIPEFIPLRNIIHSVVPVFVHLPRIPNGTLIHALTLADPERAQDAGLSRSRPTSGYGPAAGIQSPPVDPYLLHQYGQSAEQQAEW